MPEDLDERFQSKGMPLPVAICSLFQSFYLASRPVSGLVMFEVMLGVGTGGFQDMIDGLRAQDPSLLATFNPTANVTASWWAAVTVTVAHTRLGLLPHNGNKPWALKSDGARTRFEGFGRWFAFYATNPYSAATFGAIVSVVTTVTATWLSKPAQGSPASRSPSTRQFTM
jgi:hypothetical protein